MRPPQIMTPTGTEKVDFSIKKTKQTDGKNHQKKEKTRTKRTRTVFVSGLFFSVCSGYVFALLFIFSCKTLHSLRCWTHKPRINTRP